MMVVVPLSTVDLDMPDGGQVVIEQRDATEVLERGDQRIAAAGADAWTPAFDVTPAGLVDYLVTEAGVIVVPDRSKLASLREP